MNHLDTAASYQNGENEKFVGSLIRDRRGAVFLATKYGITRTPEGALKIDNRPEAIRAACDASLQRLGIEPHRSVLPSPHRSECVHRGICRNAQGSHRRRQDPLYRPVGMQRADVAPSVRGTSSGGRAERVLTVVTRPGKRNAGGLS